MMIAQMEAAALAARSGGCGSAAQDGGAAHRQASITGHVQQRQEEQREYLAPRLDQQGQQGQAATPRAPPPPPSGSRPPPDSASGRCVPLLACPHDGIQLCFLRSTMPLSTLPPPPTRTSTSPPPAALRAAAQHPLCPPRRCSCASSDAPASPHIPCNLILSSLPALLLRTVTAARGQSCSAPSHRRSRASPALASSPNTPTVSQARASTPRWATRKTTRASRPTGVLLLPPNSKPGISSCRITTSRGWGACPSQSRTALKGCTARAASTLRCPRVPP